MSRGHVPLRDFLYLDAERVRSLLAQLEGGVVERVAQRLTKSQEARAGASIFRLFDFGGSLLREKSSEQTKSLQDALFLLFEEAAQEADLISQPAEISDPEAWSSGIIHQTLRPAELIRITAPPASWTPVTSVSELNDSRDGLDSLRDSLITRP